MVPYGDDADAAHPLRKAGLDAVYVTHYTPLGSRLVHAQQELDKVGLTANIVVGWDREQFTDDDIRCLFPSAEVFRKVALELHWGFTWMKTGELSVDMKHAAAYYDMVKRGYRNALVLEDDFTLQDGLVEQVTDVLSNLHRWEEPGRPFSILHLGSYRESTAVDYSTGLQTREDESSKGTIGYIISWRGAQHVLDNLPFQVTADHMISNSMLRTAPRFRYVHKPFLVVPQNDFGKRVVGTHQASDFIRTDDLIDCEGSRCPCITPNTTAATIKHVNTCCCNGASLKPGWTCPSPGKCS